MSFDYVRFAATASRLLRAAGRDVVLTRRPAAYNTDTAVAAVTAEAVTCVGVLLALKDDGRSAPGREGGTVREQSDMRAFLGGLSAGPSPGDTLTFGADVWAVLDVKPLAPAGTAVMFTCRVGR